MNSREKKKKVVQFSFIRLKLNWKFEKCTTFLGATNAKALISILKRLLVMRKVILSQVFALKWQWKASRQDGNLHSQFLSFRSTFLHIYHFCRCNSRLNACYIVCTSFFYPLFSANRRWWYENFSFNIRLYKWLRKIKYINFLSFLHYSSANMCAFYFNVHAINLNSYG